MEKRIEEKLNREGIVLSEPAVWVNCESVMQNGRLVLTSKHLVFNLNDAVKPAIVIDIDTINAIKHEKMHTDPNILAITYLQYDTTRFSVLDFEHWENAIETQRMQPHIGKTDSSPIQGPQMYK
jgi:hypothetical protein